MKTVGVGVGAILIRDGKILLGKRHSDPEKAGSALHGEGTWTLPGGKVNYGETLEQGARREVVEETGLTIGRLVLVSVADDIVYDAHYVTVVFLCKDFSEEPEVREPEKITEWEWFSPNALPRPMYLPSEKAIRNYRRGVAY